MAKKTHDYGLKMSVSYICPKTGKRHSVSIQEYDITSSEAECELCGSHGSVTVSIQKCKGCNKFHDIDIRSW